MSSFPESFLVKVNRLNDLRCDWSPRTATFIKYNPTVLIMDRDPNHDEIITEIDALTTYVRMYQQRGDICKTDQQLTYYLKRGPFSSLLEEKIPFDDLEEKINSYIKTLEDFYAQADQFKQGNPQVYKRAKKEWQVSKLLRSNEHKIKKLMKSRIETSEEREKRVSAGRQKYATLLDSDATPEEIVKILYPEIFN